MEPYICVLVTKQYNREPSHFKRSRIQKFVIKETILIQITRFQIKVSKVSKVSNPPLRYKLLFIYSHRTDVLQEDQSNRYPPWMLLHTGVWQLGFKSRRGHQVEPGVHSTTPVAFASEANEAALNDWFFVFDDWGFMFIDVVRLFYDCFVC